MCPGEAGERQTLKSHERGSDQYGASVEDTDWVKRRRVAAVRHLETQIRFRRVSACGPCAVEGKWARRSRVPGCAGLPLGAPGSFLVCDPSVLPNSTDHPAFTLMSCS